MSDAFDLQRFVSAQAPVFDSALAELRAGRKRSHWMWFVFPQLRGLGLSPTSEHFGLSGLEEARAYLAHPLLGERLQRCTQAVLAVENRSPREIFGSPDDMKFTSSMTLFAIAAPERPNLFDQAIQYCCAGQMDARTVALLQRER
ncbi:MAG TPA: DUF1810 domain-containing protein [Bosea sp. (in: a-proteobacteria)]|jgi:uncharacterized protein (DUF1810 family)|uniref:DUF1810 domain-containing protein n=1 Tax=Bosea sp. (in: a-proteobacteria) TaxID=1871050 RepID=UPI002E1651A3|nr:DUF1810 domain-containing protein [Bosea sp. (in: a-proteobacteria)]